MTFQNPFIYITIVSFYLTINTIKAQTEEYIQKQIPKNEEYKEAIIDSIYGITLYEKLNFMLGGDSIRNCKGYACNGWIQDYWKNGKLLHKGYYMDGYLKVYENFYPNGQTERVFKTIDDFRSNMKQYYPNGVIKSDVKYYKSTPMKWEDFYPNGQLEYYEETHRSGEYYIAQKSYQENGTPLSVFELAEKKRLIYTKKEYYETGGIKEEGELQYNSDMLDYQKIGKWAIYDENGKLIRDEYYINGKMNNEKEY